MKISKEKLEMLKKNDKFILVFFAVVVYLFFLFLKMNFISLKFSIILLMLIVVLYGIQLKANIFGIAEVLYVVAITVFGYMSTNTVNMVCMTGISTATMLAAKMLTVYYQENKSYQKALVLSMILGFTVYAILNLKGYYAGGRYRAWGELWSGNYMPATVIAIHFCQSLVIIFPTLLYFKKHKILSSLMLIFAVVSIVYTFILENRIQLMIMIITLFCEVIIYLIHSRNEKSDSKRHVLWGIEAVVGVIIIGIFLIVLNVGGIRQTEVYMKLISIMSRDGGIFNNVRFKIQRNVIMQMFENPMGGNHADLLGLPHCHNVWLDMANSYGLIPFALFGVYTLISFANMVKVVIDKSVDMELKLTLTGTYLSYVLYYSVESPFISTQYNTLVPWMLINGVAAGLIFRKKEINVK